MWRFTKIYLDTKTEMITDNFELFIKENEVWINLESIQNESRVVQFIAVGLAALLAYLITPELLAIIGMILGQALYISHTRN